MIWSHGKDALLKMHEEINEMFPTIRLSLEFSPDSVTFLDTRVHIRHGHLTTSLYRKPTDNPQMLHSTSFHPRHVKDAIPYGQALRISRICSDNKDRDRHLLELQNTLQRSGYRGESIRRQFTKATRQRREDLLTRRQDNAKSDRVPFVATYFPGAEKLRRGLRRFQHLLEEDERLAKALPAPPVLAFRQPPNLRRLLVKSKFHSQDHQPENYVRPCGKSRCSTCTAICTETTITRNQAKHQITGAHTCQSRHVVYLVRCRKDCAEAWYIGETRQTVRERMTGHRFNIRSGSPLPVAAHFASPGHTEADMLVSVLRGGLRNTQLRRIHEQKFVKLFDTHKTGLNRDLGFMAHYK